MVISLEEVNKNYRKENDELKSKNEELNQKVYRKVLEYEALLLRYRELEQKYQQDRSDISKKESRMTPDKLKQLCKVLATEKQSLI